MMNCRCYLFIVILLSIKMIGYADLWWQKLAQKQGPKVCAEEQVLDRERYFSTPWTGGNLCGTETLIRFSCCHGYGRISGERGCPLVKSMKNIAETLKEVGAAVFMRHAESSGLLPLLANQGAFTVFAAKDSAFQSLTPDEDKALNMSKHSRSRPPLFLFTIAEGRLSTSDLPDSLTTLYREGSLIVSKFKNGLITVNCIPLVATDLEATNGVIHMTETLLLPTGRTTITDLLVRSQPLSTMATAIVRAQLANELRDRRPITLFAPVDQAWESLPQPFMEALMEDVSSLKVLLHYHMVDSVWCNSASGSETELTTLEGSSIHLWCNASGKFVNDARVLEGDHVAGNGFVHHIDAVLIPDRVRSLAELLEFREMSLFLKLADVGGFLSILKRQGAYTIFAPTNEAFEDLPNDTLSNLMSESSLARSIVSYHIASGRQSTSKFIDGQNLPTLKGQKSFLRVKIQEKRVTLETSLVITANLQARNGIMHVLDHVLSPPALTVAEILQEGNFSSFVDILNQTEPNLLNILNNATATYTVFAPDNAAMNDTPPGMVTRLLADPPLLYQMAAHHVLSTFVVECGLEPGLIYQYATISGRNLTLRKEDSGFVTVARLATVTTADLIATNGVVHRVSRFIQL